MKHALIPLIFALSLTGCASLGLGTGNGTTASAVELNAVEAYEIVIDLADSYRRPCFADKYIGGGPDHPLCLLNDEEWTNFKSVIAPADAIVAAAQQSGSMADGDAKRLALLGRQIFIMLKEAKGD